MVTDLILTILFTPLSWLFGVLPSVDYPDWLDNASCTGSMATCYSSDAGGWLATADNWMPVEALLQVAPILLTIAGVKLVLKLARMLVSLFTGGGGNAA